MTDQQAEEQKERLRLLADFWLKQLGLNYWLVNLEYFDDTGDFANAAGSTHSHPRFGVERIVARTFVSWEYMEATIQFCLLECANFNDDELETMFVHECCHILVNEMRYVTDCECENFNVRHEERVVTQLAKAFIWVRDAAKESAA